MPYIQYVPHKQHKLYLKPLDLSAQRSTRKENSCILQIAWLIIPKMCQPFKEGKSFLFGFNSGITSLTIISIWTHFVSLTPYKRLPANSQPKNVHVKTISFSVIFK